MGIEEGKINDTRLYRCLDRILPHKTKLERHLKQRYGELFGAEFDVLLYDLTSSYVEGAAENNPMMRRGYSRDHRPDCEQMVIALIVNSEGFPFSYETFDGNRADVSTMETNALGDGRITIGGYTRPLDPITRAVVLGNLAHRRARWPGIANPTRRSPEIPPADATPAAAPGSRNTSPA